MRKNIAASIVVLVATGCFALPTPRNHQSAKSAVSGGTAAAVVGAIVGGVGLVVMTAYENESSYHITSALMIAAGASLLVTGGMAWAEGSSYLSHHPQQDVASDEAVARALPPSPPTPSPGELACRQRRSDELRKAHTIADLDARGKALSAVPRCEPPVAARDAVSPP